MLLILAGQFERARRAAVEAGLPDRQFSDPGRTGWAFLGPGNEYQAKALERGKHYYWLMPGASFECIRECQARQLIHLPIGELPPCPKT